MKINKSYANILRTTLAIVFSGILLTSCSHDDEDNLSQLPPPTISEVEIGASNQGVIGRDFHFNAEVVAGSTIEMVKINIKPIENEMYTHDWSFEIFWDKFKGLKNSTVHEHFDIPEDAPEGKFELAITVTDENGTSLVEVYEVNLIDPANLPVDPYLYLWDFYSNGGASYMSINETLENPEGVAYSSGDVFQSSATIKDVKGDGKMYLIFIKKSANHLPKIVDDIDFSKVIVYDVFEHKNWEDVGSFSNRIFAWEAEEERVSPELTIGASVDNNKPGQNPINEEKSWQTTEYYFGVVYTNTTYDISVYHYFELDISME
ncbi:DUF4625 domain-containing protein [Zobellia uliginosa]|uniref:DUF4625 domain-containing protein n=1 Tax=Zobellia uliginosa TaxID=143224 RepID=UPI0026E3DA54|nr:DUF4625 domain-containing protein [Zobellia uliginosa]MDO6519392.1 DUF4625 domain-containing protein [Zobellia uliginosa]